MKITKYSLLSFFENSYIFVIILSLFYGSFLGTVIGFKKLNIVLYAFSYIILFFRILLSKDIKVNKEISFYFITSILLLIISLPFWMTTYSINSYLGLVAAFFVFIFNLNTKFFTRLIKITTIIVTFLTLYEYVIKDYIYIEETIINGKKYLLNVKMFGGRDKIFRAKAIFPGPLTLAQFATGIAFVFRNNIKWLAMALVICLLANARLGIIVVFGIIFIKYIPLIVNLKFNKGFLFSLITIVITSIIFLMFLVDQKSIDRILLAFDTNNHGNFKRMEYWLDGMKEWWNYGLHHKVFGNNGYFRSLYDNNAENGWITLLLENGVLGFIYYLLPLVVISILSIIKKTTHVFLMMVLFFAMFIQTYYMGSSTNLMYWFVLFVYYSELVKGNYEENI